MSNDTTPRHLSDAGVSIWLDDLSRERLTSGSLEALIEEKNVVGVTTNPSIFHAALSNGESYAAQVAELAAAGMDAEEAVFKITTDDVAAACDLFAPISAATNGVDGRVSIEVDPRLARETAETIAEAKDLYDKVGRENVLIKIPATVEGLEAITADPGRRHQRERHPDLLAGALPRGHQRLPHRAGAAKANGHDLSKIHSVASFFVSRVDTEIDASAERHRHRRSPGPARQGRRGQRPPGLPGLRGVLHLRALERAGRGRRQRAAPAVGLHRREGPGPAGHPLRHRAVRTEHGEHHAGKDPRRHRRPRRRSPGTPSPAPTPRPTPCSTSWPPWAWTTTRSWTSSRSKAWTSSWPPGTSCSPTSPHSLQEGRELMSSLGFIATGAAQAAIEAHVPALVADEVASRIAAKDATLWGPDGRGRGRHPPGLGGRRAESRAPWCPASWHCATSCAPRA